MAPLSPGEGGSPAPLRLRWRGLWASLGGAAWGLCHLSRPLPWLVPLALVPLFLLLGTRRAGWWGWLHGSATWAVAVWWIVPTVTVHGGLPGWLGVLALLLLAAVLGLYDALLATLGARLWKRGRVLDLLALPALWVALEWVRGWALSGFPWNLAAYAWIEVPGVLPLASWIGAYGVSAIVLTPALGLARGATTRRWEPIAVGLVLPTIVLAVAARFLVPSEQQGAPLAVAVIQPNTPNRPAYDPVENFADYQRLLALSEPFCQPGRLLLWPESATWPRNWQEDPLLRSDVESLLARGCSVLLNSPTRDGNDIFNSVLLLSTQDAQIDEQRADKRHLVPFGEYVPLRKVLPFLGTIARMVGEFRPARELSLLDWRGEKIGVAVCFEVVFPGETAELVRAGATLLATVTNDAWYGDTAAPRQHLRAARFRAAETRRWLLRAAITGISAVVRPDGSLAAEIGVGEADTLAVPVFGRHGQTPYVRAPRLVPWAAIALVALAWLTGRRRRREPPPTP